MSMRFGAISIPVCKQIAKPAGCRRAIKQSYSEAFRARQRWDPGRLVMRLVAKMNGPFESATEILAGIEVADFERHSD